MCQGCDFPEKRKSVKINHEVYTESVLEMGEITKRIIFYF